MKNAECSSPDKNNSDKSLNVEKTYSVKFSAEVEEIGGMNEDSLEAMNDCTQMNDINIARLTNKKKQYLQDAIQDKNGAYSYLEDPVEYKKARKRLQNRESAVRSRQRKKSYQEELEQLIDEQNEKISALQRREKYLSTQNNSLTTENQALKQQVSYFQENLANSSLVGGHLQPPVVDTGKLIIDQDKIDQLKAEILQKINQRFLSKDMQSHANKHLNDQEHLIKRERFEGIQLDKISIIRDSEDEPMDDFSELP